MSAQAERNEGERRCRVVPAHRLAGASAEPGIPTPLSRGAVGGLWSPRVDKVPLVAQDLGAASRR